MMLARGGSRDAGRRQCGTDQPSAAGRRLAGASRGAGRPGSLPRAGDVAPPGPDADRAASPRPDPARAARKRPAAPDVAARGHRAVEVLTWRSGPLVPSSWPRRGQRLYPMVTRTSDASPGSGSRRRPGLAQVSRGMRWCQFSPVGPPLPLGKGDLDLHHGPNQTGWRCSVRRFAGRAAHTLRCPTKTAPNETPPRCRPLWLHR
jgi:hypothetical protein